MMIESGCAASLASTTCRGDAVRNGELVSGEHEAWELPALKGTKEEREGGEGNASKVTMLEDFFCERPRERKRELPSCISLFPKVHFF